MSFILKCNFIWIKLWFYFRLQSELRGLMVSFITILIYLIFSNYCLYSENVICFLPMVLLFYKFWNIDIITFVFINTRLNFKNLLNSVLKIYVIKAVMLTINFLNKKTDFCLLLKIKFNTSLKLSGFINLIEIEP